MHEPSLMCFATNSESVNKNVCFEDVIAQELMS